MVSAISTHREYGCIYKDKEIEMYELRSHNIRVGATKRNEQTLDLGMSMFRTLSKLTPPRK
jgi:hypothetical protein